MKEHLRNELLALIGAELTQAQLQTVARRFDEAAAGYDIRRAETALAVIGREEYERLIKTYIVVKRMEGLSEKTLRNYCLHLRSMMMAMRKPPAETTANDLRLFLFRYQEERGISNRSLDSMRTAICSFFRWAAGEHYIPGNPTETLRPIRYEVRPRKALTQIELEHLRRACRTPRETAIVELLYSTGCRVSELCGLRLDDIDWNSGSVHLLGKGRKHRTSYLNAKAEVALRAYLAWRRHTSVYALCNDRGGEQMTPAGVEKLVRGLASRAGIEGLTPHVMRHTTATQAVRSGMPVSDIQRLLGHSSVATTMIYAHTSQEDVCAGHKKYIV